MQAFGIEIQTSIPPDLGKRTRYYQSMMDSDNLLKGQNYRELKESYVLFICLSDPFKQGLPVYTFKNTCEENPAAVLNTKYFIMRLHTQKKATKNCLRSCNT